MLSMMFVLYLHIFFFKQKTAYEVRISDWSSDVCSSDLERGNRDDCERPAPRAAARGGSRRLQRVQDLLVGIDERAFEALDSLRKARRHRIGRLLRAGSVGYAVPCRPRLRRGGLGAIR